MFKYIKRTIALLLFAIIILKILQYIEKREYINTGEVLIEKIEAYKATNKKLPETLGDINEPECMGTGPYYEKINDNQYKIVFCFGFDNDELSYDSKTGKWSCTP